MTERVAVIAVHGVGHHQPREAARACADMLALTGNYAPFVESPMRIAVERVGPESDGDAKAQALRRETSRFNPLSSFEERPAFARTPEVIEDPEISFMKEQLSGYVPEEEDCVYETVSLKSTRRTDGCEVHVFDMYWTDLSRVNTTGMRMIGELYQLLFYVSGLGRHTLDFALNAFDDANGIWKWMGLCQRYAERILVLWIPVLNLCGAGLAIMLLPQFLLNHMDAVAVLAGYFLMFMLAGFAALFILEPGRRWPWLFTAAMIVAILGAFVFCCSPSEQLAALVLSSWVLAGAMIVALMRVYDKRRPGALLVSVVCVVAIGLLLAYRVIPHAAELTAEGLPEVGIRTGESVYEVLHLAWALFIVAAFLVTLLDMVSWRWYPDSASRRTVWTANLSLTLPGLVVLILNLGLWEGVLKASRSYFDGQTGMWIERLIAAGTPWTLGLVMAGGALSVLSIGWAIAPSLLGEIKPRMVAQRGDARACGKSLSEGFHWMRYCGEFVRWSFVLVIPISWALGEEGARWIHAERLAGFNQMVAAFRDFSAQMTLWVGLVLIAVVAGPLRGLGTGLRTSIDIAIDVANWLRLHPIEQNPRAKICSRFTSLLNAVLDDHPAGGRRFDKVIIFSHSQGTVISSELLRYLHMTGHALSGRLRERNPVLYTMGCPLHQLYSQRFPLQYAWARRETPDVPAPKPDPAELNIVRWVNDYRSGDYVGRHLWYDTADPDIWQPPYRHTAPTIDEGSIGAGAHMHYWDDSAPAVAMRLDSLI